MPNWSPDGYAELKEILADAVDIDATISDRVNVVKDRLANSRASYESAERVKTDFEQAIRLCAACLDQNALSRSHIENVATALLQSVMQAVYAETGDPDYKELAFRLEPVESEGAITGLKPQIVQDGVADDPKSHGGGVQNLVSFAIRLLYVLMNPNLTQTIVLDEPLVNLSSKAWRYVMEFLKDLQKDVQLQVIVITHAITEAPHMIHVRKKGDTSYVTMETI